MILIGLGSNLGERECQLEQALQCLEQAGDLNIISVSNLYETKPVGDTDQPEFLNMAARVKTLLTPIELLHRCLAVENKMGRVRTRRWGPRLIDIDLLEYDARRAHQPELTLPHPEIVHRGFVLIPLNDIAPELILENGKTVAEMVGQYMAGTQNDIRLWKKVSWDTLRKCLV
jgi:2-amino-4-hydroxy-6-hydroxymethyldihydropteridine diphosphokinase